MFICNNDYTRAFESLQWRKKQRDFDPNKTDFSIAINMGYDAIEKYQYLIDIIDAFNRQNNSLLKDSKYKCDQLQKFGVNCQEVYPNWSP